MGKETRSYSETIWRSLSIILLAVTLTEGAETIKKVEDFSMANWIAQEMESTENQLTHFDAVGNGKLDSEAIALLRSLRSTFQFENANTEPTRELLAGVMSYLVEFPSGATEVEIREQYVLPGESVAHKASEDLQIYARYARETATQKGIQAALFLASLLSLAISLKFSSSSNEANWRRSGKRKNKLKNQLTGDSAAVTLDSDDDTARELAQRLQEERLQNTLRS